MLQVCKHSGALLGCVRARLKAVVPALTALALLAPSSSAVAAMTPEQRQQFQCVGCHTGNAKGYTDPVTGRKKETLMDIGRKRSADHADVACQECHVEGFDTFPHFGKKILGCMDCHPREGEGAQEDALYDFSRIEQEFRGTVHFTEHRQTFTCAQCHHPHYIKATTQLGTPKQILETHNQWCLNCHSFNPKQPPDTIEGWPGLADPAKPGLVAEHASIPHAARHLRKIRCLDCHSGTEHTVSHALPLGGAAPGCASCHARDSVQARLYRYVDAKAQPVGFTHPAILHDSYVMGATRYLPLDIVAYFVVGGTLLGGTVHGIMQCIRRKRFEHGGSRISADD